MVVPRVAFSMLSTKTGGLEGLQPSNGACSTHGARGTLRWAAEQRYGRQQRPDPNQIQISHSWKNRQVAALEDEGPRLSCHEKELESPSPLLLDGRGWRAAAPGHHPRCLISAPPRLPQASVWG